ncbi:hypothetical protein AB0J63_44045 [Streptosporangium canum]|uniref:hypothetical protein n=1 Tax=Streptosporangium canum TaxID=324952 RepID=UPI00343F9438
MALPEGARLICYRRRGDNAEEQLAVKGAPAREGVHDLTSADLSVSVAMVACDTSQFPTRASLEVR